MNAPRRVWNSLLLLVLCGCSDSRETVLRSRPEAADGGDDAGAPRKVTLGTCFGAETECSTNAPTTPYVAGPAVECTETDLGMGSIVWNHAKDDVDCPNPPCILDTADTLPHSDGTIDVQGRLRLNGQLTDALWLASFGSDGTLAQASVLGYSLPSRLAEPKNFVPSGWDTNRNAFVTARSGDINTDSLFDFTVTRFRRADGASSDLARVNRAFQVSTRPAAGGGFITLVAWDNPRTDHGAAPRTLPYRFDLSRYDEQGRLVYNQTKLTYTLPATEAELVDVDEQGGVVLVLSQIEELSLPVPMRLDNSYIDFLSRRLVRLDATTGNVAWARDVPLRSDAVTHAVATDGSLFRVRVPWKSSDGKYWEHGAPVLEHLDRAGVSEWTMTLPASESESRATLAPSPDGGIAIATRGTSQSSVQFRTVSADGRRCERFEVACPVANEGPCGEAPFHVANDGSIYFSVGKIARPE